MTKDMELFGSSNQVELFVAKSVEPTTKRFSKKKHRLFPLLNEELKYLSYGTFSFLIMSKEFKKRNNGTIVLRLKVGDLYIHLHDESTYELESLTVDNVSDQLYDVVVNGYALKLSSEIPSGNHLCDVQNSADIPYPSLELIEGLFYFFSDWELDHEDYPRDNKFVNVYRSEGNLKISMSDLSPQQTLSGHYSRILFKPDELVSVSFDTANLIIKTTEGIYKFSTY